MGDSPLIGEEIILGKKVEKPTPVSREELKSLVREVLEEKQLFETKREELPTKEQELISTEEFLKLWGERLRKAGKLAEPHVKRLGEALKKELKEIQKKLKEKKREKYENEYGRVEVVELPEKEEKPIMTLPSLSPTIEKPPKGIGIELKKV